VLAEASEQKQPAALLLADDFTLLREGLAAICERAGSYRIVAQCSDGVQTREALAATAPDLAVIDFNLPGVSALELLAELRDSGSPVRTVVMAAQRDRKVVMESLRAGARGVLLESDTSAEVLLGLEQVMNGGVCLSPAFSLPEVFGNGAAEEAHAPDPLECLSTREFQVYSLLVDGVRAKEIAARLNLSPKTVDTYRASLMRKLNINHLPGLVRFAMEHEITRPNGLAIQRRSEPAPDRYVAEPENAAPFARNGCTSRVQSPFAAAATRPDRAGANGERISTRNPNNGFLSR
jgi:DNA-binding NarL/FixJ family response regulator